MTEFGSSSTSNGRNAANILCISEQDADSIVQSLHETDYFDATTMAPLSSTSLVSKSP
jgi:hypothetical protein